MNQTWTAAEIETVKAMVGRHSDREIGETLGKSFTSVQKLRKREGIRVPNVGASVPKAGTPSPKAGTVAPGVRARLGIMDEPANTVAVKQRIPDNNAPLEPLLLVSDAHIPYHSKVWWDLLLQVGRSLRPQHIVVIGDFADFYSVSDHDKAPERANRMDEELAEVDACLDQLDALGARDKLYIEGNHEDRLRRHLMKNPALARVVSTEKLLRLKERGWEFVPYKRHAQRGAVHFTHDVGASGRNAVFRALDVYGHSVVSGHTHRFAYIVEGTATGECKLSATFGWGGDVEQVDYMNLAKARRDWALGFAAGYFDSRSGYCYLTPLPVVHGTVCFNGTLFRAQG
jgi:UDP-2,3-diacylglucosamine pyrophosphatase LpxH